MFSLTRDEDYNHKVVIAYHTHAASILNAIAVKLGVDKKFLKDCYDDLEKTITE